MKENGMYVASFDDGSKGKRRRRQNRVKKTTPGFNIVGYIYVVLVGLLCLLPFLLLISVSFTPESEIATRGFALIPERFTTAAYEYLFSEPKKIVNAYTVSIFITVVGTALGLFITSLTGYVISRKTFVLSNKLSFFFYFTTLFSGGLLPYYILLVKYLHVTDTIAALLIPGMLSVFNILVMKSFINGIPYEIYESAKVDGASEFTIYSRIYLPMLKPCLATIGIFTALGYWNNWSAAKLYITKNELYPLQYLLYTMTANLDPMVQESMSQTGKSLNLPTQSVKFAMTVIATGPIILVYPFAQKYFVGGMTLGAVKG